MPTINKGESRKDYIPRCVAYIMKNEGLDAKSATGKCEGMFDEHVKTGKNYYDDEQEINEFQPPDSGDAPKEVKHILQIVYSTCRESWVKDHPNDKENQGNKTMCSQTAWSAVHKAGYNKDKDGNWKKEMTEESQEFLFSCILESITEQKIENTDGTTKIIEDENWVTMKATAAIGDRMMNDTFVPYSELKKSLQEWNGTYHDYSHFGTSYPAFPFPRENIGYIIGYQDNVQANDLTKAITMDVHISKKSPKYNEWKSFMDINKIAGRTTNVSMAVLAKPKYIKASEVNCLETINKEQMIPCLFDIRPKALTTCILGACNDTKGCGLNTHIDTECKNSKDCKCKNNEVPIGGANAEMTEEDAKKIAELNEEIKKLKEEK